MQRKIKLPVAVNDVLTLKAKNGTGFKHMKFVKLVIDNNRLEWEFRSLHRHVIYGTSPTQTVRLPYFGPDSWICLSIPLEIHFGAHGLKAAFILNLPASVEVQRNDPSSNGLFS